MNTQRVLKIYKRWARLVASLQHVFLLAIRLFWGWGFIQAGFGKFTNFEAAVGSFSALGIPVPQINVALASGAELVCGSCLLLGLGSRIATVPLLFIMGVAYCTAFRTELLGVLSDPKAFMQAPPFLFAYASLIVLIFGAGKLSLDAVIGKRLKG